MNQFTGGKLTQHVTADKSNSAKQILSLLLYCRCIHLLLLTFTYSFCRGASEFTSHFNSEAPELYCHVTDSAPCWLFRLVCVCVSTAVLGSLLVPQRFCDTQHFSQRLIHFVNSFIIVYQEVADAGVFTVSLQCFSHYFFLVHSAARTLAIHFYLHSI